MECDRFRDTVHSEIAKNVAALLTGLSHPAGFECHFGKLCDVKKFRTAQMVVTFDDSGVDAANVDSCYDRRFFGMFPVDLDLAVEFRELAMSCSEKLVNSETDRRTRLVKFVDFVAERAWADGSEQNKADNKPSFHRISFRDFMVYLRPRPRFLTAACAITAISRINCQAQKQDRPLVFWHRGRRQFAPAQSRSG